MGGVDGFLEIRHAPGRIRSGRFRHSFTWVLAWMDQSRMQTFTIVFQSHFVVGNVGTHWLAYSSCQALIHQV